MMQVPHALHVILAHKFRKMFAKDLLSRVIDDAQGNGIRFGVALLEIRILSLGRRRVQMSHGFGLVLETS